MRVLLVTNMMAPYRIPLFNRLARRFDLRVLFAEMRSPGRQWDVPLEEVAFRYGIVQGATRTTRAMLGLARTVWRDQPDALIVGGWGFPEAWCAMLTARATGVPVVVWAGLSKGSSLATGKVARGARYLFLKAASGFVTYSRTSADLLRELGADGRCMAIGRNVGDVDYFGGEYHRDAAQPSTTRFLFVGELVERKGVRQLLDALSRLSNGNWTLMVAGKGPLETTVQEAARSDVRIKFVGFQGRSGVRTLMQNADVFVLPSLRELGAIVTSEALAAGLFVVASIRDGVAPDLITPSNGVLFDPGEPAAFDAALAAAVGRVGSPEWSRTSSAEAFLATRPLDMYADAFERAVSMALGAAPAQGNP